MNTISEFLTALDKLNFVDFRDDKLVSKDGFSIGIDTEINESLTGNIPAAQIILRITRGNTYVQSWGSTSEDDNKEIVLWFAKLRYAIEEKQREEERETEKRDKALFNMLTGMK